MSVVTRLTQTTVARFARTIATVSPPSRGNYSLLEDSDLAYFERSIGKINVKTTDLDSYNVDWMKWFKGSSKCVLLPQTSEEVSAIMRHCFKRRLAVVPQSGNTGLVGGSVPVYDEVILSLRNVNKRFDFEPNSGVMKCDAGFILEELNEKLTPNSYMMPIDLGAKGSCLIGGNIATCAGGLRLIRFGSLHNHVVGLEVVLPNEKGSVVKFGSDLRKDNTGLHSHHMFIGSEGQLGVITGVTMTAVPKPLSCQVALLGLETFEKCCELLRLAKKALGEILSAFELIDCEAMKCLLENDSLSNVIESNPPFNVLVETLGSDETHDKKKMQRFLTSAIEDEIAVDGVQAKNSQEASEIWKLRETIPLSLVRDGYVYKHDVSLPLKDFYLLTEAVREQVKGLSRRVVTFGHMGDGNSHLNVTTDKYSTELTNRLYPFIYEWVASHGGSISAEHGIGQVKRNYAILGKGFDSNIALSVKKIFDPRRILSPYKML